MRRWKNIKVWKCQLINVHKGVNKGWTKDYPRSTENPLRVSRICSGLSKHKWEGEMQNHFQKRKHSYLQRTNLYSYYLMQLIAWREQFVPVDLKPSVDMQCNFNCELLNNRIFLIKGNCNGNTYFLRNSAYSMLVSQS